MYETILEKESEDGFKIALYKGGGRNGIPSDVTMEFEKGELSGWIKFHQGAVVDALYEEGSHYSKNSGTYNKLIDVFGKDIASLLSEDEQKQHLGTIVSKDVERKKVKLDLGPFTLIPNDYI